MKKVRKTVKRLYIFAKKNYFLTAVICIMGFIFLVILVKFITSKDDTVYIKVKVSQGYWWASTLKPSYWLAESLQKGDSELDLSGKPIAEIVEVRRYPVGYSSNGSDQYDVYLMVRLQAHLNKKTGVYSFKRSTISVGSPIDFEFGRVTLSGTIMELSKKPIHDTYIEKVVTLQKLEAEPWEFEAIQKGATYFDGEETVVEVIDVSKENSYAVYTNFGNNYPIFLKPPVNITATVRMKLIQKGNNLIFRNEIPLILGKEINMSLDTFIFDKFIISSIQ